MLSSHLATMPASASAIIPTPGASPSSASANTPGSSRAAHDLSPSLAWMRQRHDWTALQTGLWRAVRAAHDAWMELEHTAEHERKAGAQESAAALDGLADVQYQTYKRIEAYAVPYFTAE